MPTTEFRGPPFGLLLDRPSSTHIKPAESMTAEYPEMEGIWFSDACQTQSQKKNRPVAIPYRHSAYSKAGEQETVQSSCTSHPASSNRDLFVWRSAEPKGFKHTMSRARWQCPSARYHRECLQGLILSQQQTRTRKQCSTGVRSTTDQPNLAT
jgi:hypothetical protein